MRRAALSARARCWRRRAEPRRPPSCARRRRPGADADDGRARDGGARAGGGRRDRVAVGGRPAPRRSARTSAAPPRRARAPRHRRRAGRGHERRRSAGRRSTCSPSARGPTRSPRRRRRSRRCAAALPESGPVGSALGRPRLERELLVAAHRGRAARAPRTRRKLGDASGDLVRGIVATWTPPARAAGRAGSRRVGRQAPARRSATRCATPAPRTGPPDLDVALYPLERLLAPLQYPRGAGGDRAGAHRARRGHARALPSSTSAERITRAVKVHLGLAVDLAALPARLERARGAPARATAASCTALRRRGATRGAARGARRASCSSPSGPCPPVARLARSASMRAAARARGRLRRPAAARRRGGPPRGARGPARRRAALARRGRAASPPPRTGLLSHPDDDDVDALERIARERPVVALGAALAAEIALRGEGVERRGSPAWRALGEAPLDVVDARARRCRP